MDMTPKLFSLTPTDKIRLAAELDGWKPNTYRGYGHYPPNLNPLININQDFEYKPYFTSYDAIIPLIQKQPRNIRTRISLHITMRDKDTNDVARCFQFMDATPSKLLDALLIATGKAEL